MDMLSSIGSVIRFTKKLSILACTCSAAPPPRYRYIDASHHRNHLLHSIPVNVILPFHTSLDPFFPIEDSTFCCAFSESFSAAWMSGIERWKICYEFLRDKRAYQDPQGTDVCPGGDNIVAELGSEMAKNGNIVSDSESSRRTYRSHQLDRLPS